MNATSPDWDFQEAQNVSWAEIKYTREEINNAAKKLVVYNNTPGFDAGAWAEYQNALPIINNWRSSHAFPLNTFRQNLYRLANSVDPKYLTAQRIKRLSSISLKLERFPGMKLTQMQDIGGCRAVVRSARMVRMLHEAYTNSRVKHKIVHFDDYIKFPRESGYRGLHLIWRYHSDRSETYNGLKIEMQIRSLYQHSWATAVETVGTFLQQALKSSLGEQPWLRFFSLMGTAVAIKERTPMVPGTPTDHKELLSELKHYANTLDVENRLSTFGAALKILEQPGLQDADYFLLQIDPSGRTVTVRGFGLSQLDLATNEYLEAEKTIGKSGDKDAVLVSVSSLSSLKRAYPNYFADTKIFSDLVKATLA